MSLVLLYSAGGGFSQWCSKQLIRFLLGFFLLFVISMTQIRLWYSFAYGLYVFSLLCLLLTSFMGVIGMGAQRWINFVFFQFQPSEIMRISLILALARYFNDNPVTEQLRLRALVIPLVLIAIPVLITIKQPDLGTAMLLLIGGGGLFFIAGVSFRFFAGVFLSFVCFFPFFWHFLHDYQKKRILMFLNPQSDPLGAGYHIIQSKIAIGSGGVWGKGFLAGTQSTLNFLPEKQTDFIFTLLSEEFGFIGVIVLILLYCSLILLNISFSFHVRDYFSRFVIVGMTLSFALYAVINIAMVVGFLPVVGIPLPLISYGGTSLITIMASLGIVLSAALYRTKTHCINRVPL
ncbi:MAG: rod shape-determining protein RodA [Holosporales bacterium]|nr:rod shape-determining protein RodA [Holosporales bacterium]